LTNDLLQQVIAAGPMQGGRLAAALAGAGGGFLGELNQAYAEFGGIASGIAGVGTTAAFANREVINNYYNIEVSGGVGSGPSIGKAIVDAIKSYERTSGAVWQGA
jgi:predicted ribosomally synthesized peptide with SipW-like signal peptide